MSRAAGLDKFLIEYPGMSLQPIRTDGVKLSGYFDFGATGLGREVDDRYELDLRVDRGFPNVIPEVRETAGKIPKTDDFHVNGDGTLCLGSHLRLKKKLLEAPNLVSFAENCLVPYLFNVSVKLREGGSFVTGELAHGTKGIVQDYMEMFCLNTPFKIIRALELLGTKKRIANKHLCPCGCGVRLGRCSIHHRLNAFRPTAPRSWFRGHARDVAGRRFG